MTAYPKREVRAIIDAALRDQGRRQRRSKYEVALDALVRVADDFDGADGVAIEDALRVLRIKVDADDA